MASTGEVGCIGENIHEALMLAMNATGIGLEGKSILVTLGPLADKVDFLSSARTLQSLGYILYTTHGTHNIFMQEGIETILVPKRDEHGKNPILAMIDRREFALVINSPSDHLREEEKSGYLIRRQSVDRKIPLITNVKLAKFFVRSLAHEQKVGGYRGQAYSELIETPPAKPL
jgi:carbamoyl-phosphate synthase large subunit